jgi:hypothetical protein
LISAYTVYALVGTVERFHKGTASVALLIWASCLSAVLLVVSGLTAKLARDRRAARRATRPVQWALLVWSPIAAFAVGYGIGGVDVGMILVFGGVVAGAVLGPAVPPGFLASTTTVQGVRVSVGVAVFFFPIFMAAIFLAQRTHDRVALEVLFAVAPVVFRALDLIVQRILRRNRKGRPHTALV